MWAASIVTLPPVISNTCVPASPEESEKWLDINTKYSALWPNITEFRAEDVPSDAADWTGVPNKYEDHFSEKPGK